MMSSKTSRSVQKLEKPRPLKSSDSRTSFQNVISVNVPTKSKADLMDDLETLHIGISNCNYDEVTVADIARMCAIIKEHGDTLDVEYKDQLDRYFVTLRNASRDDNLDAVSKLRLLEVIELRAMHWQNAENLGYYYKDKIASLEVNKPRDRLRSSGASSPNMNFLPVQNHLVNTTNISLAPGEILRSSGKYEKPTKITGKNYFKDEILIRNSDSGKVMGIKGRRVHMIEELSDTVISFQRVNPAARDRLVQITGPGEEAIGYAKLLVEDTIRRNASPIKEHADDEITNHNFYKVDNQLPMKRELSHSFSMSDATVERFSLPISIGHDTIYITGMKAELLQTAKLVLEAYFTGQPEVEKNEFNQKFLNSNLQNFGDPQRLPLRKQTSLKNFNFANSTASLKEQDSKRSSFSFSSSDDENNRESQTNKIERNKVVQDLPSTLQSFPERKMQDQFIEPSECQRNFRRSLSVPTDVPLINDHNDMPLSPREELLSPLLMSSEAETPSIPPPCYKKQYSREFLLCCAKSHFSHTQPKDYASIHRDYPEIICQSPIMFDPTKFLESEQNHDIQEE